MRTIEELRGDTMLLGETAAQADEVLIAYAVAFESGGANLSEWMMRYPVQAEELAFYAASLRFGDTEAPTADADVRTLDERLTRVSRAILAGLRPAAPFESLLRAAEARGLDLSTLAGRLGLTEPYVMKLHRRLFAPDSLPAALIAALADILSRTVGEMLIYLRQPPQMATGASYRATTAPALADQEDFAAVVAADPNLTEEQRARWRDDSVDPA